MQEALGEETQYLGIFLNFLKNIFGLIHGTWKFPGWGLNPWYSSDPSHSSDNAVALFVIYLFIYLFLSFCLF